MRLLGYTLQFYCIFFTFCTFNFILPQFVVNIFSLIANVLLYFSATLWILELLQDYFFKAEVDKKAKAVLITGCDTGFGNACAKILHDKGFLVYACCYDPESVGAAKLQDTCSARLKIVPLDVTKDDSVKEAVKVVESSLGNRKLWAIVNNAGVLKGFHTELSSMKEYEDCLQVNTLGVIRVTKAFLPLIRLSKGRVINICSISGRLRAPFLGPYCISKTAAVAFTEVLRLELRDFGVRAISIEPEFFKTQMCSEKYLRNVFAESMSRVNEEIKEAYGSKYIEKAIDVFLNVFLNCSDNLKLVHDAIEAAVSLENPADVYKPSRNIFFKIIYMAGERTATIFVDLTIMLVVYVLGLPPPKTGVRYLPRLIKM